MRIFAKKAFQFDHPAGQEASVTVQAQGFADVPDWVEKSAMFKLASKAGEVELIGSRADELAAGKDDKSDKAAKAAAAKAAKAEAEAKAAEEEAKRQAGQPPAK